MGPVDKDPAPPKAIPIFFNVEMGHENSKQIFKNSLVERLKNKEVKVELQQV